jgi:cytochrome b561
MSLSRTSIALHWLIALGIFGLLVFGVIISNTPSGPEKTALIQIHKSFGMIVGFLALWRIVNRIREGWPTPLSPRPAWEERMAHITHTALLAATVAMPLTGIAKSITYGRPVDIFGLRLIPAKLMEKNDAWNEVFSIAHAGIGYTLAALIAVHIAAAVRHHVVHRDLTLARMTGRPVA